MKQFMNGKWILENISDNNTKEKIIDYLSTFFKDTPKEKLVEIISKTPVIFANNLKESSAGTIIENLKQFGATASFIPETKNEVLANETQNKATASISTEKSFSEASSSSTKIHGLKVDLVKMLLEANKELWLLLSMFLIVGIMNFLIVPNQMILSLYILPTLFAAYYFGRNHAVLTSFASIFLVCFVIYFMPNLFSTQNQFDLLEEGWFNFTMWGGILVITAYTMGTLYEKHKAKILELQSTYQGILVILRHFISKDKYTENHCYRAAAYAAKIASYLGLDRERIEDIRAAALLHDLGKLDISRELLYKAAALSKEEFTLMKHHPEMGAEMLDTIKGPLGRIIPIILSHHDKFDGTGYHQVEGEHIPLEARIISVADVYDALTSDRPYRKAMSPFDVKEQIAKGSGIEFDPKVVNAFLQAFQSGEMEISSVMV